MCVGAMFWAGVRRVAYGLSSSRLGRLAAPPGAEPSGSGITANEIGGRCTPPMAIYGPQIEDEAAGVHLGFWTSNQTADIDT